jgi:uncharacterized integral membrane protein
MKVMVDHVVVLEILIMLLVMEFIMISKDDVNMYYGGVMD